ncbi:unnamed protein product [Clonostachys rosea f. rosea IK726]|uniref:Uncharacterized protein n=1 Tax=Clonostachys rosea f. rosea IK726 TaxID=1349383 RepID=A0ACA9TP25_BIOOC|nr:unnamed protein product [Clonostachys rosea f. rosea IK726]
MAPSSRASSTRSATFPLNRADSNLAQRLSFLQFDSKAAEPTANDFQRVQELMLQNRPSAKRSSTLDYKDANQALSIVAQGRVPNATPGMINALVKSGADVSVARRKSDNILKMFKGENQEEVRSDVLPVATRNCSDDVVFALALHADKISLNQALPVAITTNSHVKASILLARGADASPLCTAFLDVVARDNHEMAEILLKEVNGACQSCRNKALVHTAKMRFPVTAQKLLSRGADVKFDNGAALRAAIHSGADDIAFQIASHPSIMGQAVLLDAVVSDAYNYKKYSLLPVLFQAGAKGNTTDEMVINAVNSQQLDLIKDLVQQGALSALSSMAVGTCLRSSINVSRLDILQALLAGKPSPEIMAEALKQTHSISKLDYVYQVVDLLLRSGLAGHESVSDALLYTVNRTVSASDERVHLNLFQLLLASGAADVNFHGGKAIVDTVSRAHVNILSLLLQAKYRVSTDSLAAALTPAIGVKPDDVKIRVIEMLLGKTSTAGPMGATVTPQDRQRLISVAMSAATQYLDMKVLQLLASLTTSVDPFSTAVTTLVHRTNGWSSIQGLVVMHFLLEHGASGQGVEDAYLKAAQAHTYEAVNLLEPVVDPKIRLKALGRLTSSSPKWIEHKNLWLLQLLCDGGCQGDSINAALLQAVAIVSKGDGSIAALHVLLDSSANVNYQNGDALRVAATSGAVEALEIMMRYGASSNSIANAIHNAISALLTEKRALKVIDTLVHEMEANKPGVKLDLRSTKQGQAPILVTCLSVHRKSALLVKRLGELGCDADEQFTATIHEYQNVGQEVTTVLIWALSPVSAGQISSEVIAALIESKANVNYATSNSKTTPLILAARYGRHDIVKKLLIAKARPTTRDSFNCTALYYAAQLGHFEVVKLLVKAKSLVNDGSLHEAARNLHSDVVAALISGGHDPNFRSSRPEHKGRNALEEVCLLADGSRNQTRLEETLMGIADGKAKVLTPNGDRNCLFLAFDNPRPIPVTSIVLDRIMWRDLNDEKNVFIREVRETGTKIFYSPPMFLRKGLAGCDPSHINHLLKLLHEKQCVDRYYAEFGPGDDGMFQPEDAVGVPVAIAREEKKRRADAEKRRAEAEEHQRKLQRQQQEAEHKVQVDGWVQHQKRTQASLAHQSKMQQQEQIKNQQLRAMQQKQAMKKTK